MSVVSAAYEYVKSMIDRVQGMKVLLVDQETIGIVSMVFTQSNILEKEVFLVERIEATQKAPERMKHVKAICFLRPTPQNFLLLNNELKDARYSEYYLYFSNIVPHQRLEQLANSDELEVVAQVQEYFADYYAINPELFSLNLPSTSGLTNDESLWAPYEESIFSRMVDGLFAAAISLRMNPVIRYSRNSPLCQKLAQSLQQRFESEQSLIEALRPQGASVVLIVDRRDDPVTPLLNQWTYQAMLHELVGLEKNRVSIKGEEMVFSAKEDPFFEEHLSSNFGDLGLAVKNLVSNFQVQTKNQAQLDSIEQMQRFVENFPEFRKLSGNVAKHVAAVHELSTAIEKSNLLSISSLEQDLVCEDPRAQDHLRRVLAVMADPNHSNFERLRLALLYVIRYEQNRLAPGVLQLKEALTAAGVDQPQVALIDCLLNFSSRFVQANDLFSHGVLSLAKKAIERQFGGVQNVYTQHKSWAVGIAEQALKGRLREAQFPLVDSHRMQAANEKPMHAIVFMAGGATFEEARDFRALNGQVSSGVAVLGGSTIHNSKSFLADVAQLMRSSSGVLHQGSD